MDWVSKSLFWEGPSLYSSYPSHVAAFLPNRPFPYFQVHLSQRLQSLIRVTAYDCVPGANGDP